MRISKSKFVKLISIKEHECKALEEYLEEKAALQDSKQILLPHCKNMRHDSISSGWS